MSFLCLSRECCTGKFIVPLCVLTIIRSCEMNLYNLKIRDFIRVKCPYSVQIYLNIISASIWLTSTMFTESRHGIRKRRFTN